MVNPSNQPAPPASPQDPWFARHLERIIAGILAIMGMAAVISGRDSYVVGVVGTALGYLFGVGRGSLSKK